jgi:5-methylthioadenosine/S-adenosylhomocysteine deaminase
VLVVFLSLAALLPAVARPLLLTADYVLTMDDRQRLLEDGAVLIEDEKILAVGSREDLTRQHPEVRIVDYGNAVISPGFISGHTHAPMSLFRGIANDKSLEDWLQNYIFPAESKNVSAGFVYWGTRLGVAELLSSGVTTFVDMYFFEEEVARAAKDAGIRGVLGETVFEFPSPASRSWQDSIERADRYIRKYRNDPLIVPAIAPHAIYTNTEETLKACRDLAQKHGVPLIIHLSETRTEQQGSKEKYGKTPARALYDWGVFDVPTIAAHGVWLNEADAKLLAEKNVGVVHNPSANTMLASGVAPVQMLRNAGVAVGLGVDGPAGANNDFNLMEEMDLAAKLQKVDKLDPQALGAKDVLTMATIEGARAIHLADKTGSLEAGNLAHIVVIRLDSLNSPPMYDVYAHLAYSLKSSDVEAVYVHGRLLLSNGELIYENHDELREKAQFYRSRIIESLK